ncbi:hypothetical protein GCM10025870_31450 [Agromyces marinus]|uniref:Uncharacterized protein n=1 Tax=Agromyces marinus TaxID=1389020 RepID=A0ABN6YJI5_9MICO|nr:hypothetical protein GCM10025870_31450 [Agromyces marinus]
MGVVAVARVAEREREVGAVLADGGDGLGRFGLDEADLHARVAPGELDHEFGHDLGRRRRERHEPDPAGAEPAEFGEFAAGRFERGRDGAAVPCEHPLRG